MYIVLIILILFAICFFTSLFTPKSYDYDMLKMFSGIFAAILFIALLVLGVIISSKDASAKVDIAQFEAIRTTINKQRTVSGTELERVEMTKQIIENNRWLAEQQASSKNPWVSYFYSKSYLTVQPLK